MRIPTDYYRREDAGGEPDAEVHRGLRCYLPEGLRVRGLVTASELTDAAFNEAVLRELEAAAS